MRKQLFISLAILFFLTFGTITVVAYGRGYRFGLTNGKIEVSGTGLLVTSSLPDGAQVFINDTLSTATDDTINLFPGDYTVKIVKDGYFPWEKKIKIQKEVVAKADAWLLPTAPKLESITASGVKNPVIDPSLTRLAYTVASSSAKKNGVYILDMTTRPILTLQSASEQIIDDRYHTFSQAQVKWSPDGQELIATISGALAFDATTDRIFLLNTDGYNDNLQDVTATLDLVQSTWEKELAEKEKARLATFKTALRKLIQTNFNVLAYSPDDEKILYQASQSATISYVIKPRLIGVEATPEQRDIKTGELYVYDTKEDKNYRLPVSKSVIASEQSERGNLDEIASSPSAPRNDGKTRLSWFPDSSHLLYVHDKRIDVIEYDGGNQTTVYAGPFVDNYVFPWPAGNKILMLTNLGNSDIQPNLYTIGLE